MPVTTGMSLDAFISPDGRYVGFYSDATNLVANDTNGRRDVFVRDLLTGTTGALTVWEPAPVANFTGTPASGTAPLTVQFNDTSSRSPAYWTWDFGDGSNSTGQNPSHIYAEAGTYTVNLTAANAGGSNKMVKAGYVGVTAPQTEFTVFADGIAQYHGLDGIPDVPGADTTARYFYNQITTGDLSSS